MSGREWKSLKALKAGYVNVVLQHTFAITLVDSSPSVPVCGQSTLSKSIYDFHIQTLFFPTKANETHEERHLDYDNLLTHMKKSHFFQLKIARIPLWNSLSHTTYCFLIMCVDIFQTDLS